MTTERVLFVNAIKRCNVHCDRCYLTESSRRDKTALSEEAIEKVLSSSWANEGRLTVIWQGGEVSLVGKDLLKCLIMAAQSLAPHAEHTMVSNLFSLPNWLIDISHEFFRGKIETTFAMNGKYSLAKSNEVFLARFKKNYLKILSENINCPINLELNDYTINLGVDALLDYLEGLGRARVEFDISIDFESFLKDPSYTLYGYPLLPLTATYADFSSFVKDFDLKIHERKLSEVISSTLIEEMREKKASTMFAVQRSSDFLTLNPDGVLTTNPLFSDLQPTYLGNVLDEDIEILLASRKRQHFMRHELRKTAGCMNCSFYELCSGGPSHAPTFDGSGECAGMRQLRIHLQDSER